MTESASEGYLGRYNHRVWSVHLRADHSAAVQSYTSVHEYFHDALSSSSSYGLLLNALAYLDVHEPGCHETRFAGFLDRCRRTHETFATFLAWLTFNESTQLKEVLNSDPTYRGYFETAYQLVSQIPNRFVRYHVVTAICRTCMQVPWISVVLDHGLTSVLPGNFRSRDFPDARLDALRLVLLPLSWQLLRNHVRAHLENLVGWELMEREDTPEVESNLLTDAAYEPLSLGLTTALYTFFASALESLGLPTLDFNGHQKFTNLVIKEAERISSPRKDIGLFLIPSSNETEEELLVYAFRNEQLVNSESPLNATLSKLSAIAKPDRDRLVSGLPDHEHMFLVVRSGAQLLAHYELDPCGHNRANELGPRGGLFLRQSIQKERGRLVELFEVESPAELAALKFSLQPLPLVANLSHTAVQSGWADDAWYNAIRDNTYPTVLMDYVPFAHLRDWIMNRALPFSYQILSCPYDGKVFSVFTCRPGPPGSPLFLVPCSDIASGTLAFYIDEILAAGDRDIPKLQLNGEETRTLQFTLGHLFREEVFFSFTGGQQRPEELNDARLLDRGH